MGEGKYIPVQCIKCGNMVEHEDDLVVMIYPPDDQDQEDINLHVHCADKIRTFCRDAREGKRVRGW